MAGRTSEEDLKRILRCSRQLEEHPDPTNADDLNDEWTNLANEHLDTLAADALADLARAGLCD